MFKRCTECKKILVNMKKCVRDVLNVKQFCEKLCKSCAECEKIMYQMC